jgi:hypothetical protein
LLRGLTTDAEAVSDLGPGVAAAAQAFDCHVERLIEIVAQSEQIAQRFDVAAGCPTSGGLDRPGAERGVRAVLD